jgi:ABC-2 type transport system ATP-binding protein
MERGRLVACDTPSALRSLLPGVLLELRGASVELAVAALERLPAVRKLEVFGETLHISVPDAGPALSAVQTALRQAGLSDAHLRPILPSLEDVFIALLHTGAKPDGGAAQPADAPPSNGRPA